MGAILGAFVQYIITFVFMVAAAVAGVFCGKKWRESKKAKEADGKKKE